ncbi:hypothetical protein PENTCL1PPCAC_22076, partial [Pristionchus entomophagus]
RTCPSPRPPPQNLCPWSHHTPPAWWMLHHPEPEISQRRVSASSSGTSCRRCTRTTPCPRCVRVVA